MDKIQYAFTCSPDIVRQRFEDNFERLQEEMKGSGIKLHFESEEERRGTCMVRAIMQTDTFDDFTPEQCLTGGASSFFATIVPLNNVSSVEILFRRLHALYHSIRQLICEELF